ncbi:hypothetical protein L596_015476 [Steinernema carpocapsae]|uniref:Uncharacterized protein n=1 Tax=Steinernema carpocapsae TaxID=34508 RepID=A0A4V6A389_STECR|nr:hypothetical protein L596_015476 [Steinernema carpocapsae]
MPSPKKLVIKALEEIGFSPLNSAVTRTQELLECDLNFSDDSENEEDYEAMLLGEITALDNDEDDFLENLLVQELKKS